MQSKSSFLAVVLVVCLSFSRSSSQGSQSPCPVGCGRGNCSAGSCVCQKGWTGTSCDIPCSLDCGDGKCGARENGSEFCICVPGYTGTPCRSNKTNSTEDARRSSSDSPDGSTTMVTRDSVNMTSHNKSGATHDEGDPTEKPASETETTTTTLNTESKRRCSAGIVCQHGVCNREGIECDCDRGWAGFLCDTPCSLDCGQFAECFPISGLQICRCKPGYTYPSCNSTQPRPQELTSTTNVPQTNTVSKTSLRPLSERICSPKAAVFECQHGVCEIEPGKDGMFRVEYVCVCDADWIGLLCNVRCTLDCGQNGHCEQFQNGSLICRCSDGYMGQACAELRPSVKPEFRTPSWHWWIVGACALLLLILLLLLLFLPYYLWKKRFIFIMKLVYLFQPFEDEDDKQYDAFVSYKSTAFDEDFVVNTLHPKLEESLHFRLCLHFRDFVPGETIANNIIDAINKSRRTIMILTPSYIQSEFCRLEYQRAQHEMLKRKQRLIPIVLQDISGEREFMDETLKSILDTVTYIEWPKDQSEKLVGKFWKRLELSMPKKRQTCSQDHEADSPECNTGSTYSESNIKDIPPISPTQVNSTCILDSLPFCSGVSALPNPEKVTSCTENGIISKDFDSIDLNSNGCAMTTSESYKSRNGKCTSSC